MGGTHYFRSHFGCNHLPQEVNQTPLKFFEEEEIYWEPALDSSQLYSQLARHKYREIPRSQLR